MPEQRKEGSKEKDHRKVCVTHRTAKARDSMPKKTKFVRIRLYCFFNFTT